MTTGIQSINWLDGRPVKFFHDAAGLCFEVPDSERDAVDTILKVTGLRACGNFTVDIAWKAGKTTHHWITSPEARDVKVKIHGSIQTERSNTP